MTLSATAGLSVGVDNMIYTSLVPPPDLPTVITIPVTNVGSNTATSGGNVTADGGATVTARGVCWSTSPAPTLLDSYTTDGTGLGTFTSAVTGLTPSTTYYLRAYATNLSGTSYGAEFSFTTIPEYLFVSGSAGSGDFTCYNASNTIVVAGLPSTFIAYPGSNSIFIAGMKIRYLTGTAVKAGAYMHGYIAATGPWCNDLYPPPESRVATTTELPPAIIQRPYFSIYPNPTTGYVTLEQKRGTPFSTIRVELFGMRGERLLNQVLTGGGKYDLNFADLQPGLYFVKVVADNYVETFKLVRAR